MVCAGRAGGRIARGLRDGRDTSGGIGVGLRLKSRFSGRRRICGAENIVDFKVTGPLRTAGTSV